MRLATRENVRQIDRRAAAEFGLTSEILIERVGQKMSAIFLEIVSDYFPKAPPEVLVWCGPGNNGADGKALAKHLQAAGLQVRIEETLEWPLPTRGIVVDAYLGVGLQRDIEGPLKKQIEILNRSSIPVVAVDIPTGLDANRGIPLGIAVKADWTLTVAPPKPGLFLQDGPSFGGKVRSVDIGFPQSLLAEEANEVFLVGRESARRLLPPRSNTANKTHYGHLLVIAGSPGMAGAARMVCESAVRMGSGYVTLCSLDADLSGRLPADLLSLSFENFLQNDLRKYSAVVVGPGLGTGESTQQILHHLRRQHTKVLADADAITVLAQKKGESLPMEWLLTPHAGEMSRLLGDPAREIERDRIAFAKKGQAQWGAQILLKGFRSVLRNATKSYIIGSGNGALAKAGSGDALAGFIGSLMAQGLQTTRAAVLGAYLHGKIADDWIRRDHDPRVLRASDLAELLDASLRDLKKKP